MISTSSARHTSTKALVIALCAVSIPAQALDPVAPAATQTATQAASASSAAPTQRSGVLSIFNCGASGNKQEIGAAVGGVLGGLLGNRIAGRGSRTLGTVLGGALGVAAGSALGCKLQKNDQVKAERAMQDALAKNQNQSWQSDETGASGTVEVGTSATAAAGLANLSFANGVEPASGFTAIGAAYVASTNANIRSLPGTNGKLLGQIAAGQRVWVPASVTASPWYLISDQGVAQGYVSNALLKRAPVSTSASANNCKMVRQTITTADAAAQSETFQACKDSSGQWVMTRV